MHFLQNPEIFAEKLRLRESVNALRARSIRRETRAQATNAQHPTRLLVADLVYTLTYTMHPCTHYMPTVYTYSQPTHRRLRWHKHPRTRPHSHTHPTPQARFKMTLTHTDARIISHMHAHCPTPYSTATGPQSILLKRVFGAVSVVVQTERKSSMNPWHPPSASW